MDKRLFFRLYAHTIPVRGRERSALYDLQHGHVLRIPNACYDLIMQFRTHPIGVVERMQPEETVGWVEQYVRYLLSRDAGFLTDEPERFPELDLTWQTPHSLQTAIIGYAFGQYDLWLVLRQLDRLRCQHLELRLDGGPEDLEQLPEQLTEFDDAAFRTITLFIRHQPLLSRTRFVEGLYEQCRKIDRIVVYDCPEDERKPKTEHVLYTGKSLEEMRPQQPRYIINLNYFSECQRFNPFYNRKVCIDQRGEIRNSLGQPRSFGNVRTCAIEEVIGQPDFQELWHVSPDQIEDLRDSELRYCLFVADELEKDTGSGLYRIRQRTRPAPAVPA